MVPLSAEPQSHYVSIRAIEGSRTRAHENSRRSRCLHSQAVQKAPVYLDGHPIPHIPFSDDHDVHITISTGGFQTFKCVHHGSFACWPIIGINQNLPPEVRVHPENILPLGLVLGPNQPVRHWSRAPERGRTRGMPPVRLYIVHGRTHGIPQE